VCDLQPATPQSEHSDFESRYNLAAIAQQLRDVPPGVLSAPGLLFLRQVCCVCESVPVFVVWSR
jgi:hypothetical protein